MYIKATVLAITKNAEDQDIEMKIDRIILGDMQLNFGSIHAKFSDETLSYVESSLSDPSEALPALDVGKSYYFHLQDNDYDFIIIDFAPDYDSSFLDGAYYDA